MKTVKVHIFFFLILSDLSGFGPNYDGKVKNILLSELISSVTVKAGNSRTRILLCPENVKKMIVETRSVLGRVLDQRCVGNKGCDVESDKIFNILVMGLYENRL